MNSRVAGWLLFTWVVGIAQAHASTAQTITFPPIATQSTTTPIFTLGATSSSGLAIVYTIVAGKDIASVTGSTVTLSGTPGAVTVRANQWGNNKFASAPAVYQAFTVVKNLAGSSPWRSIAYGSGTVFGVKNDGTLWAWGFNLDGALGDGTFVNKSVPEQIGTDTNWSTVAAYDQTVALKTDGTLWTWGHNYYGQLGNGTQSDTNHPQQVGTSLWKAIAAGYGFTLAIRADGTLWEAGNGMGSNATNAFIQIGTDTDWSSGSASFSHAMLVKTDGTLWGIGDNSTGELGIGSTGGPYYGTYQSPVQTGTAANWKSASAGDSFTVAVRTDGTLWSWGVNYQDILGDGTASGPDVTSPVQVGTATNWQSVAAGVSDSLATKTDGTLWAWGDNQVGEIGDGTLTPRPSPEQIGTDTNWQLVAIGSATSVATKSDGTLWTWGQASSSFGYGFRGFRPVDPAFGNLKSYVTTPYHSVVVRSDGSLWSWGTNNTGQLGDGTTTNHKFPEQIGTETDWAALMAGASAWGRLSLPLMC